MAETADELKRHVEEARSRLDQDLSRLEYRVRAELNWRVQFQRRPWSFLGAAFGGAMLLALAFSWTLAGARSGR